MKRKPKSVGYRPSDRARAQAILVLEHACSSAHQNLYATGCDLGVTLTARRLAYRAEQACYDLQSRGARRECQAEAALWLAEGWHP